MSRWLQLGLNFYILVQTRQQAGKYRFSHRLLYFNATPRLLKA